MKKKYMNNIKYKNDTNIILAGKDKNNEPSFVNSPIHRGSTVLFKNVADMKKNIENIMKLSLTMCQ